MSAGRQPGSGRLLRRVLLCVGCSMAAVLPAGAVVSRIYPLADVIKDSDAIAVAAVGARTGKSKLLPLTRTAVLKGAPGFDRMRLILPGGDDRTQLAVLRGRLQKGRSAVFFIKQKRFTLGYVDGTWFRLTPPEDPRSQPWRFVHLEPLLRRTFHGTSAELKQVVADVLAGKRQAPAPDPKVKPE